MDQRQKTVLAKLVVHDAYENYMEEDGVSGHVTEFLQDEGATEEEVEEIFNMGFDMVNRITH